jgi:capsular polysaccharide biosynthesis protein
MRSVFATVRRHWKVLVLATTLGAAAGASMIIVVPTQYTSESLVLLPPVGSTNGQPGVRNPGTEVRIASSGVVLGPAGRAVDPPLSVQAIKKTVQIGAPTDDVVQFRASADSSERAEALAQAVAESEVDYLNTAASSQGSAEAQALANRQAALESSLKTVTAEIEKARARLRDVSPSSTSGRADASALAQLTAQQANLVLEVDQVKSKQAGDETGADATIIQVATPATRPGTVGRMILTTGLGAALALLLTTLTLGLLGSRDRRLRYRDEIADSIGSPVVGSMRSRGQKTSAGWTSLMASYEPGSVDLWALRQMLRQLTPAVDFDDQTNEVEVGEHRLVHPQSMTVITLADDPRALAMGPQIASFAAGAGIRTRLVGMPQHDSASSLWAACAPERGKDEVRPGLLLDPRARRPKGQTDFTVVLAVLDRLKPELAQLPRTEVTLLAVSAGAATAEDLARAAVVADESGRLITGVIVADPDDLDRTTGRLLQHERAQQVSLPSRLTGVRPTQPGRSNITGFPGSTP